MTPVTVPTGSAFAAPVYVAGGGLDVTVEFAGTVALPPDPPLDVPFPPSAAQLVKFWPPRKVPTVTASDMCSECNSAAAAVVLVAQKVMVKFVVVAAPLQMGCHSCAS